MKLQPVEDRLLIELVEQEQKDYILPEGVDRESFRIGRVIDIGEQVTVGVDIIGERTKEALPLTKEYLIGKTVLFEKYGPLHLKQFNEKWFLVRQQYILAIIKE